MEKIYEGKAKIVYAGPEEGTYRVYYKDDATAFNGAKHGRIEGKGTVNNRISARLFEYLDKHGLQSHFIRMLSERESLVWQVEIVPLEVIIRYRAAGSFSKRYGVPEDTALKAPLVEFSLKSDALSDPLITEDAAVALSIATREEVVTLRRQALEIGTLLREFFATRGLILIDLKLEFGRKDGKILLADEISPDTMRLWRKDTHEKMDKDRFRRDLGGVEEAYQEVLRLVLEKV